jgi:methyl-accepting chemotaxis protein/methyl-accepting chemotaxis protein-1 (serine sensor receptor)
MQTTLPVFEAIGRDTVALNALQGKLAADNRADGQSAGMVGSLTLTVGFAVLVLACTGAWFVVRGLDKDLKRITSEMGETASQVASAATQVASASQSLAQGASEQAASLEETSASSEELTSMTRKNADNAEAAAGLMQQVDRSVAVANQTLEEMVDSMNEINTSADKISRIIKVIDEIAFQTNILALNAAVEAARAGEAGMGFAVVADEVRNLAQRSAQAAKDTAELIEESIATSGEGKNKLERVAQAIASITGGAEKVKMLVDEVNAGSQEQTRGFEQIAKALVNMEQVTQSAAATTEESASSSEELSAMAESLRDVVNRLGTMVGTHDRGSGSRFAHSGVSA